MAKYLTRRGDGAVIEMSTDEFRKDFDEGTNDAADRCKIDPLEPERIWTA
jgi:hypothetical protein